MTKIIDGLTEYLLTQTVVMVDAINLWQSESDDSMELFHIGISADDSMELFHIGISAGRLKLIGDVLLELIRLSPDGEDKEDAIAAWDAYERMKESIA